MKRLKAVALTVCVIVLLAFWQGIGWTLYLGPFGASQYGSFRNSTGMRVQTPWFNCEVWNGQSAPYYDGMLKA